MKIFIYQRLDQDNKLLEKISTKRKEVEEFALNDLRSIFGNELGTHPDTGRPMTLEDWGIEDAIDLIWHCNYDLDQPQNLLRFISYEDKDENS